MKVSLQGVFRHLDVVSCLPLQYRFGNPTTYDGENGRHSIHRSLGGTSGVRVPRSVYLITAVLFIGILLTALNVYELRSLQRDHWERSHSAAAPSSEDDREESSDRRGGRKPVAWIKAKDVSIRAEVNRFNGTVVFRFSLSRATWITSSTSSVVWVTNTA